MRGWFSALRVARREARRGKGRAALVVAMIALPVAAITYFAVVWDTFQLTPEETAQRMMGTAEAAVAWPHDRAVRQTPASFLSFPVDRGAGQQDAATAPTVRRLLALLPAGSRAIPDLRGHLMVRTTTGTAPLDARMLDYADPLARGILRPLSGRVPAAVDEVALTPPAARRLGAGLGGTVRLAQGDRAFRVVGIVEDPSDLRGLTLLLYPGAQPAGTLSANRTDARWLVATPGPLTWDEVKRLNTYGVVAVSRHVIAHPPDPGDLYIDIQDGNSVPTGVKVLVGGLAVLEIVLLAGPAFAVGASRRRRELALVAASGGTPAQLRRIVLADGVVLGGTAAVSGVALGIALAAATRPLLEAYLADSRSGGFRVFPLALLGIAGLAVVTGVLAALVPAWIAARQDVVAALAGRRGITRSRRRWLVLGVAVGAAGAGLAAYGAVAVYDEMILTGLAVAEFGLVLCTPTIVGLVGRLGRWLPLAPRIALRDISRNRTAAAPAISAVMAAVVSSLIIGMIFVAEQDREAADNRSIDQLGDVVVMRNSRTGHDDDQRSLPPAVATALRSALPVAEVHEIAVAECTGGSCGVSAQRPAARACPYLALAQEKDLSREEQRAARRDPRCAGLGKQASYFMVRGSNDGMTLVVTPEAAAAVARLDAAEAGRVAAAMRAGAVVVDDPSYLDNGRVTLGRTDFAHKDRTLPPITAPGYALPRPLAAPVAMMTADTARSLGLVAQPSVVFATTTRMPTVEEEDRARAELGSEFWVQVNRDRRYDQLFLLVLALVAAVITIGAAAIATGLAAADSRADLATLAAVGAAPRVRRALSLSRSGVIAGLGSLLGAAAGVGAAVAVLVALNGQHAEVWPELTPYAITVPWLNLAVALVVVPAVAMAGAGLLTRSRLPVERRL